LTIGGKVKGIWKNTSTANRIIAISALVSAISTLAYAAITFATLSTLGQQLTILRTQIDIMRRSSDIATDQMWQAIGNVNWMAREMDSALMQNKSAMLVTERNAKSALDASISISHQDQRAWVVMKEVQFKLIPDKSSFTVDIEFTNTGKTAAIDIRAATEIVRTDPAVEPVFDYTKEMSRMGGTMGPGQDFFSARGMMVDLSPLDFSNVILGRRKMYAAGTIWYGDVFGNAHETTFCYEYTSIPQGPPGKGLLGTFACTFHNSVK
jgi:hypothetical protein